MKSSAQDLSDKRKIVALLSDRELRAYGPKEFAFAFSLGIYFGGNGRLSPVQSRNLDVLYRGWKEFVEPIVRNSTGPISFEMREQLSNRDF